MRFGLVCALAGQERVVVGVVCDRELCKRPLMWLHGLAPSQRATERAASSAVDENVTPELDQPETGRTRDRFTAARDPELAVDRDGLGLDGVSRDVERLANLAEREMGGEVRQQTKLRRGKPGVRPILTPRYLLDLLLQRSSFVYEDADIRTLLQQAADLCQKRTDSSGVSKGKVGARLLEERLQLEPGEDGVSQP